MDGLDGSCGKSNRCVTVKGKGSIMFHVSVQMRMFRIPSGMIWGGANGNIVTGIQPEFDLHPRTHTASSIPQRWYGLGMPISGPRKLTVQPQTKWRFAHRDDHSKGQYLSYETYLE
jgi:hypothetical protein